MLTKQAHMDIKPSTDILHNMEESNLGPPLEQINLICSKVP